MESVHTKLIESFFIFFRLMKERMGCNLGVIHLTVLQVQAIIFLKRYPHSQMREIAKYFKIEFPSATTLIDTLVKMNLAERSHDDKDRRLVLISLSKQGETFVGEVEKERIKKIKEILAFLPEEDKKELLRVLQKLIIHIEEENEK